MNKEDVIRLANEARAKEHAELKLILGAFKEFEPFVGKTVYKVLLERFSRVIEARGDL